MNTLGYLHIFKFSVCLACICVWWVYGHLYHTVCMWRLEENPVELVLSLHLYMGSKDQLSCFRDKHFICWASPWLYWFFKLTNKVIDFIRESLYFAPILSHPYCTAPRILSYMTKSRGRYPAPRITCQGRELLSTVERNSMGYVMRLSQEKQSGLACSSVDRVPPWHARSLGLDAGHHIGAWWCTPVIPELWSWRQEHQGFQASLGYLRPCLLE